MYSNKPIAALTVLILLACTVSPSYGGLSKWFNKEVIPTIQGERPLKIDPTRVRISHDGQDILRASTEGDGSVYIDLGVARVQTTDLKTRLAQTAAVFSGNTAVMSQVAFEQFQKQNERMLREFEAQEMIHITRTPPPNPHQPEPDEHQAQFDRAVIIYNHTSRELMYALNGLLYTLESDTGYRHTSRSGEFYLQFDDDPTDASNVARYYLTGEEYSLFYYEGMDNIGIYRYPTSTMGN